MFLNRFNSEYLGRSDCSNCLQDRYLNDLKIRHTLPIHDGCVNTICWDETGELLLSGSDDRHIAITRVYPGPVKDADIQPTYTQQLPAKSNVFSAKFLPHSSNSQIIVGFKCGCVLNVKLDGSPNAIVETAYCHQYAVYDILIFPDDPFIFLTISHDQSVVLSDIRQPCRSNSSRSVCSQNCLGTHFPANSPMYGQTSVDFQFPVTAGDVHPVDSIRSIALGFADGFVRLFDLRRLKQSTSSPVGGNAQPQPYQLIRPLGLPAQVMERGSIRFDYGPAHITSVQFEPVHLPCRTRRSFYTTSPSFTDSDCRSRRLLVSHMYAPVFLFDLTQNEVADEKETKPIDWLPQRRPSTTIGPSEPNQSNTDPATSTDSYDSVSDGRVLMAFLHWLDRQRSANRGGDADQRPDSRNQADTDSTGSSQPTDFVSTHQQQTSQTDTSQHKSKKYPLELLTDDYVTRTLSHAPRAKQLLAYAGRRSCRTVIKTACFWGHSHILSGSECGNLIAWDRLTAEPAIAVKADGRVVNRIAPHPRLPVLACSGIDSTVKILEPDPAAEDDRNDTPRYYGAVKKQHATHASQVCDENSKFMVASLQAGSLQLRRLALSRTGQALRAILRRYSSTSRPTNNPTDCD